VFMQSFKVKNEDSSHFGKCRVVVIAELCNVGCFDIILC